MLSLKNKILIAESTHYKFTPERTIDNGLLYSSYYGHSLPRGKTYDVYERTPQNIYVMAPNRSGDWYDPELERLSHPYLLDRSDLTLVRAPLLSGELLSILEDIASDLEYLNNKDYD